MDLLKSARWILKDKSFQLSSNEVAFLTLVAKNTPLTEKQFHWLFAIHNKYVASKAQQIRRYNDDLLKYLADDAENS